MHKVRVPPRPGNTQEVVVPVKRLPTSEPVSSDDVKDIVRYRKEGAIRRNCGTHRNPNFEAPDSACLHLSCQGQP